MATPLYKVSFRRMVLVTFVFLWLIINGVGVYYIGFVQHRMTETTISRMIEQYGQVWAEQCVTRMRSGNTADLQELITSIERFEDIDSIVISDADGMVIASSDQEIIGTQAVDDESRPHTHTFGHIIELGPSPDGLFHESGHKLKSIHPLQDGDHAPPLGTLVIAFNTAWGNRQLKEYGIIGLFWLFFLTGLMVLAKFVLDWQIRRGLKEVISVTRAISRGQFNEQLHVDIGSKFEELSDSMNEMSKTLEESEQRVAHWNRALQDTVEARTRELEQSQALLAHREKMAALGLMAAGIAHEIGNPLAALSAIVSRMQTDGPSDIQEKCKTLREQIDRMHRTIDEMRMFAQPTRSRSHGKVNINAILERCVRICRFDPRSKNVQYVTKTNPSLPLLPGNEDRWQQVLINLILNALDAMESSGGTLTIITDLHEKGAEILVRDTGIGMGNEQMQNLFHPFYTTKRDGKGTGLGLSVCEGIIRNFGGRIEVQSNPGEGSEFRITVPFLDENGHTERNAHRNAENPVLSMRPSLSKVSKS